VWDKKRLSQKEEQGDEPKKDLGFGTTKSGWGQTRTRTQPLEGREKCKLIPLTQQIENGTDRRKKQRGEESQKTDDDVAVDEFERLT